MKIQQPPVKSQRLELGRRAHQCGDHVGMAELRGHIRAKEAWNRGKPVKLQAFGREMDHVIVRGLIWLRGRAWRNKPNGVR